MGGGCWTQAVTFCSCRRSDTKAWPDICEMEAESLQKFFAFDAENIGTGK